MMQTPLWLTMVGLLAGLIISPVHAGPNDFRPGPLVHDYGPVATVADPQVGAETHFKVVFDIAEAAQPGALNSSMESAARFLNMHVAAGVPAQNLAVALVVHGPASTDLTATAGNRVNAGLVAALIDAGVTIELCGQTAAYRNIKKSDLLPGVRMSLSAMTSHARLQGEGYTLNPF